MNCDILERDIFLARSHSGRESRSGLGLKRERFDDWTRCLVSALTLRVSHVSVDPEVELGGVFREALELQIC